MALIDDFTMGSSCPKKWAETASEDEKNRLKFRIHTTALHQLFITMMQASEHDKETNALQPAKLNIRKSTHGSDIAVFLGKIFMPGFKIIDLNHYKNASCLKSLPETGGALESAVAFINYFSSHIRNFSSHSKALRAFSKTAKKKKKLLGRTSRNCKSLSEASGCTTYSLRVGSHSH